MRSLNMQVLTNQLKTRYPGVVIYGIGDSAHQSSPSGHNEDDTPGSRPEDEDADNIPEHRALDVMIGPAFNLADAWNLVTDLVTRPANQRRLLYVIFYRKIWRRRNGWREETYTGSDPHTNHPHVSGEADDDANTTPWVLGPQEPQPVQEETDVKLFYAAGRGWVRAGSVFQPLTTQTAANVNAEAFGNAEVKSAEWYDALKATYAPEDVREPI
jgi:hypothetical protein